MIKEFNPCHAEDTLYLNQGVDGCQEPMSDQGLSWQEAAATNDKCGRRERRWVT